MKLCLLFLWGVVQAVSGFRHFTASQLTKRIYQDREQFSLKSHGSLVPTSSRNVMSEQLMKNIQRMSVIIGGATLLASPSFAFSLEDANKKLAEYELPPMIFVPPGFSPLVSEIGRGNIKEKMTNPIVVQFAHPQLWVVQKTSVNNNGEAGTISANDFQKGDAASLFVAAKKDLKTTQKVGTDSKELITNFLIKSFSQKGDPVDNFKILRVQEGLKGLNGQPYVIVDFGYVLNTQAGFQLDRRAIASITNVASDGAEQYVQGIVCVTTPKRWRNNNMEDTLTKIAESFRVYRLNSGIFSANNT